MVELSDQLGVPEVANPSKFCVVAVPRVEIETVGAR
jgi:hypothetical protein